MAMTNRFMDKLMNDAIAAGRFAGANVMVIRDDEELFCKSYGYADVACGAPMLRNSVFRMFSMSKPVTAAAVMLLVERGAMDLEDHVEWYLPGFRNGKVAVMCEDGDRTDDRGRRYRLEPVKRAVTVQDLLTMTSGVCYPGIEDAAHIEVDKVTQEYERKLRSYRGEEGCSGTVLFANAIGACPLAFQPGEHWMYGYSADILGAVVEVVSKKSYGEFLKQEIFEPLGMKDTGFAITPEMRNRLTESYEDDPAGGIRPFRSMNLMLGDFPNEPIFESGGAGLLSTVDDYARFARMLAGEGTLTDGERKIRILSPASVKYIRTNQIPESVRPDLNWDSLRGYGYGSLVRILLDPVAQHGPGSVGEFGWDGWMGTYFTVIPETRSVILFMKQKTNAGFDDITRKLRAVAYSML